VIKCSRRQIRKWFSYRRIKLEQIRDKTKYKTKFSYFYNIFLRVIITKSKAIKKKNLGMNLRRKRHQKNKISLKKNERKKPLSCFLKIKKKTGRIPKKILEDNKKITIKSEEPSSETPKKPSNINVILLFFVFFLFYFVFCFINKINIRLDKATLPLTLLLQITTNFPEIAPSNFSSIFSNPHNNFQISHLFSSPII